MKDFVIVMDKEKVNIDLLLQNEPSLPEAMRQLNLYHCFAIMQGGRNIAVCLLARRNGYFDVTNMATDPLYQDASMQRELLMYVFDYVRVQGERFLEIGAADSDISRHELLMRLGFRVVGVWRDYFNARAVQNTEAGGIPSHDMIRYRADVSEPLPE